MGFGRAVGLRCAPAFALAAERAVLAADPERAVLAADPERAVLAADPERAVLAADPERAVLAAGCERAVFAADRGRAVFALAFARAAFARVEGDAFLAGLAGLDAVVDDPVAPVLAPPRDPPPRFSLRRPGRDRGRLPSTPGSSLLSAATREK